MSQRPSPSQVAEPGGREPPERRGVRTFAWIWLGQVVSLFGSSLTGFGVGVWVYQQTGSVTQFALLGLFAVLPITLLSPLAGALVDRWDRRRTLIASDSVAALGTLFILTMSLAGRLEVWHLYLANLVAALAGAFQYPAFTATTTLLIPKRHLARASGLQQVGAAAGTVFAPLAGGLLLARFGLEVLVSIDLATFAVAMAVLAVVRIPRPPVSAAGREGSGSLWREAAYGWSYIRKRPGLVALLALFAVFNFGSGIVQVLVTPLVLSFATAAVLGQVLTFGAVGPLLGSALMGVWGGPRRKVTGILVFLGLAGSILLLGSLEPSAPLVAAAVFGFLFCLPVVTASSQAIWQVKVDPDVQGRVFAIRRMIAATAMPVAFAIGGPLADYVFEPLMAPGGALAGTVGRLIGVGPGRGIGLMIALMGVMILASLAVAARNPRLRRLEDEIPDAVGDQPAPVSPPG
jgi:MFS family permease